MRMQKALLGIGAIIQGYYIWVSQNLGNAFWVLLIVLGINFLASVYTKASIRNIPHDLMAYTVSIVGLVYANNHFQLDIGMVKMMIILLLFHELRVSYPIALTALKKMGLSDAASQTIATQAESALENAAQLTPEQKQQVAEYNPPDTGTGRPQ